MLQTSKPGEPRHPPSTYVNRLLEISTKLSNHNNWVNISQWKPALLHPLHGCFSFFVHFRDMLCSCADEVSTWWLVFFLFFSNSSHLYNTRIISNTFFKPDHVQWWINYWRKGSSSDDISWNDLLLLMWSWLLKFFSTNQKLIIIISIYQISG